MSLIKSNGFKIVRIAADYGHEWAQNVLQGIKEYPAAYERQKSWTDILTLTKLLYTPSPMAFAYPDMEAMRTGVFRWSTGTGRETYFTGGLYDYYGHSINRPIGCIYCGRVNGGGDSAVTSQFNADQCCWRHWCLLKPVEQHAVLHFLDTHYSGQPQKRADFVSRMQEEMKAAEAETEQQ